MSYHPLFTFTSGLTEAMTVPQGTLEECHDHVAWVERTLGFEATRYMDNPAHWRTTEPSDAVTDKVFCDVARQHNAWVVGLYRRLCEWSKKPPNKDNETLTVEQAQTFWHGLQLIDVPVDRWTEDYYTERMEHLYEVMRGRDNEAVFFDARPLTTAQADAVITLFSQYLDAHDLCLAVPNGWDELRSSSDGGYVWCEKCGAVAEEDEYDCRKRKCPLREEREVLIEQEDAP